MLHYITLEHSKILPNIIGILQTGGSTVQKQGICYKIHSYGQ